MAVTSSNEKVEIPATGEGASDNLPPGTAVIVNARPAGMSDQDTDNDDMEPVTSGFSRVSISVYSCKNSCVHVFVLFNH